MAIHAVVTPMVGVRSAARSSTYGLKSTLTCVWSRGNSARRTPWRRFSSERIAHDLRDSFSACSALPYPLVDEPLKERCTQGQHFGTALRKVAHQQIPPTPFGNGHRDH